MKPPRKAICLVLSLGVFVVVNTAGISTAAVFDDSVMYVNVSEAPSTNSVISPTNTKWAIKSGGRMFPVSATRAKYMRVATYHGTREQAYPVIPLVQPVPSVPAPVTVRLPATPQVQPVPQVPVPEYVPNYSVPQVQPVPQAPSPEYAPNYGVPRVQPAPHVPAPEYVPNYGVPRIQPAPNMPAPNYAPGTGSLQPTPDQSVPDTPPVGFRPYSLSPGGDDYAKYRYYSPLSESGVD